MPLVTQARRSWASPHHIRQGLTSRLCRSLTVLVVLRWFLGAPPSTFLPPSARLPRPGSAVNEQSAAPQVALPPEQLAAAAAGFLALATTSDSAQASMVVPSVVAEGTLDPVKAVIRAFSLTFVSEIGDKTFFIAAILAAGGADGAMKGQSQKLLTFIGAIAALAVMTFIAVALGQAFHSVPDLAGGLPVDDYASVLAFGYFGVKLLTDANSMPDDGSVAAEERAEAQEAVQGAMLPSWLANLVLPPLVLEAFLLVFAAEVGDRSFIAATALSAQGGPSSGVAVFVGSIAAHAIATLMAVALGEVISKHISEKIITYIGGLLFLIFAASSAASLSGIV